MTLAGNTPAILTPPRGLPYLLCSGSASTGRRRCPGRGSGQRRRVADRSSAIAASSPTPGPFSRISSSRSPASLGGRGDGAGAELPPAKLPKTSCPRLCLQLAVSPGCPQGWQGSGTASGAGTGPARFGSSERGAGRGRKAASGRLKHLSSVFTRPNFSPPPHRGHRRHLLNFHSQPRWPRRGGIGGSSCRAGITATPSAGARAPVPPAGDGPASVPWPVMPTHREQPGWRGSGWGPSTSLLTGKHLPSKTGKSDQILASGSRVPQEHLFWMPRNKCINCQDTPSARGETNTHKSCSNTEGSSTSQPFLQLGATSITVTFAARGCLLAVSTVLGGTFAVLLLFGAFSGSGNKQHRETKSSEPRTAQPLHPQPAAVATTSEPGREAPYKAWFALSPPPALGGRDLLFNRKLHRTKCSFFAFTFAERLRHEGSVLLPALSGKGERH